MSNDTDVEFIAELKYTGKAAYLCSDGVNEFWIPMSCVIEMKKIKGKDYEFTIPYWLARAKEII